MIVLLLIGVGIIYLVSTYEAPVIVEPSVVGVISPIIPEVTITTPVVKEPEPIIQPVLKKLRDYVEPVSTFA